MAAEKEEMIRERILAFNRRMLPRVKVAMVISAVGLITGIVLIILSGL